jgi:A/G-specific adenine glycosylase
MLLLAEQVLPIEQAYNWNQALMDMGATICGSNNPQCGTCPLQQACQAYTEMGQYSLFPSGTVLRQLRKVAEKKTRYQAQPFTSTNRYFRGRIIALLRLLPAKQRMPLAALGPQIKPEFSEADTTWLQNIIEGLVKDGLLDATEDGVCLP